VQLGFAASGLSGIVRPAQPSDTRPLPALVDRQTAAAAGPGGRIALTIDGLPVVAHVVGVLRRFPTLAAAAGFVVTDEAALAGALDAQRPGQGRADELWIAGSRLARLRLALGRAPLAQLASSFRADQQRALARAPLARGLLRTLSAAAALAAGLAVLGLLTALLGSGRDERVEDDLEAQGMSPRALHAELRARLLVAALVGVGAGLAIAIVLTRLAVATVRAAGAVADPQPPVVTVVPWLALAAWSAGMLAVLALAGRLAASLGHRGSG
jgi:hypothetical protein